MWLDFNKQNTQNFHPSRTGCKRSKEGKIKHMWDIICFFLYKLMYQIIETIGKSWIVESMLVKCKRKDWDLLFVCMPIFFPTLHTHMYIYIYEYGSMVCGLGNCGLGKMLESTRNYGGFPAEFLWIKTNKKDRCRTLKSKVNLEWKKTWK